MPQATQADPQYIQELEQRLQQHQSDAVSIDQQVGFAASQVLCILPYHCPMPWECLCSWHDCSVVVLPAGRHKCTVHLKHNHCRPAKHDFDAAGHLLMCPLLRDWIQSCTSAQANLEYAHCQNSTSFRELLRNVADYPMKSCVG